MAKINISMDDNLLKELDTYADFCYTSRSGIITNSVVMYLNQQKLTKSILDMSVTLRRIADNNKIEEKDLKDLEHFEYLAKSLTGIR